MKRKSRIWEKIKAEFESFTTVQKVLAGGTAFFLAVALIALLFFSGKKVGGAIGRIVTSDDKDDSGTEETSEEVSDFSGGILPETTDAGEEYINGTLFVGDSNMLRLVGFDLLTYKNVIGVVGMGITSFSSSKCVYFSGYSDPVTIATAVGKMQPARIVICFGTNDLLTDTDTYIKCYENAIQAMQNACPTADIIVLSVPPLAQDVSTSMGILTMAKVNAFNNALIQMCEENDLPFLNATNDILLGNDGYAKDGYMADDHYHMEEDTLKLLLQYVRTHAYNVDNVKTVSSSAPTQVAAPYKFSSTTVYSYVVSQMQAAGFKYYDGTETDEELSGEQYFSYTIDSDVVYGYEEVEANAMIDYISEMAAYSEGAKFKIEYEDADDGSHRFYIHILTPCVHEFGEWETIAESTCSTQGVRKHTCTKCGYEETEKMELDPENHEYTWVTIKEASCTEAGTESGTCSCGDVTTREIPALGHEWEETARTDTAVTYTCSRCGEQKDEDLTASGDDAGAGENQNGDDAGDDSGDGSGDGNG